MQMIGLITSEYASIPSYLSGKSTVDARRKNPLWGGNSESHITVKNA